VTQSERDPGSIRKTARLAGILYFVMSILMIFSFLYAPAAFIVNGDPAATAHKIIEGEPMYRLTILV
jgi:uncharacterized protein DUF4386